MCTAGTPPRACDYRHHHSLGAPPEVALPKGAAPSEGALRLERLFPQEVGRRRVAVEHQLVGPPAVLAGGGGGCFLGQDAAV
jgi:hypothetical protein